jgi:basic amino acid/polyamine antiporter, APA family
MREGHETHDVLPRGLGVWSAAAVLVGSTIGSGIFRVPSTVAAEAGTLGAISLLWILGAAVALAGALTLAELATMYPRAGGLYVYLREAYGPLPAFLFGWTRLLLLQPALLGGIAMVFAAYAGAFVPLTDVGTRIVAASVVLLLATTNYRSLAYGAIVQNLSTAAKVLALVALATAGFLFGSRAEGALAAPELSLAPVSWGAFGIALIAVLWTYDGWADLTYMAGEVRDPARNLPRALIGGSLVVVAVYLLVNAAYLWIPPLEEMATSTLVAADAASRIFGAPGASVVAALVMLSTFGALNGTLMSGPRVFYALARDGLFFERVARVHPVHRTPAAAIAVAALLGVGYISVRTFEQLAESFILGLWPFHVLAVSAVFLLRRREPDHPRPYRTLGYPVVPLVFMVASLGMLGNALVRQPASTLFSFGIILSGVPAYFVWKRLAGGGSDGGEPPAPAGAGAARDAVAGAAGAGAAGAEDGVRQVPGGET